MYQVVQFWKNICILLLFWAPHIGLFFSLPVTYILEGPGVSGCGWATFFNKEKKENERVWNMLMNRIHSRRKENAVATKPKYKKTGPFLVSPMQWYISTLQKSQKTIFQNAEWKMSKAYSQSLKSVLVFRPQILGPFGPPKKRHVQRTKKCVLCVLTPQFITKIYYCCSFHVFYSIKRTGWKKLRAYIL